MRMRTRLARAAPPVSPSDVALLADQLAALASAGLPAQRTWAVAAEHGPTPAVRAAAAAVVAGQRAGDTAAAALRAWLNAGLGSRAGWWIPRRVRTPDRAALQFAVVVDVTEATGAQTAQTLQRFANALRAEERAAQERAAALAGPQATATVLGLLPLAGVLLGTAVGARPWHVLVWTGPGRVCLVSGGLLWAVGRLWTRLLVRRASVPGRL